MSALTDCLNTRDIRAVVFDLDDTLYPEIEYVKSGFSAVSRRIKEDYGRECFDLMLDLFNRDRADVYNRTLDELNVSYDKSYVQRLIEIYRNHKPKLTLSAETRQALISLREGGYMLGIITDGRPHQQRAKIQALGLGGLVDSIIITDELGGEQFRKPCKKAFEIMCERFCIQPCQMVYVGDNPKKDFYIGSEGVFTVRIKHDDALYLGGEEYYMGVKENFLIDKFI